MEKVIKGYRGKYVIDDSGKVISYAYAKQRKLKPQKASQSRKGYYQVRLFNKEYPNGRLQYVHRLVWETFKGKIPEGKEIDHIDGDTSNNSVDNLQILTPRENKIKGLDKHWRGYRDEFIEHYKKLGTYKKVAKIYGINANVVFRVIKDIMHKKNFGTSKYVTVRYNPTFNDYYTDTNFREIQYKKRKRDEKGKFTKA